MPLLGRHKTSSSSSSGAAAATTSSTQASAGSSSSQANPISATNLSGQRLCESPMFGIRKQVSLSSAPSDSPQPKSVATKKSSSSSSASAMASQAQADELSSIPQQISRQQIHYAFSIMDTNSDGMIDLRDLSQMLANLGIPIDEGILSHIMSTVSKRADRRVSEAEFLDWISHFIQITDGSSQIGAPISPTSPSAATSTSPSASGAQQSRANKKQSALESKSKVARSSTANSSLVAQLPEMPRNRRGSGSGLALIRSLSNSAASEQQVSGSNSTSGFGSASKLSGKKEDQQQQQQSAISAESEARNDLKAAFAVFDLDGDGYITIDEVRAGLKLLGESWSAQELKQVFSKCSSNSNCSPQSSDLSNQRISIDDFVRLLL